MEPDLRFEQPTVKDSIIYLFKAGQITDCSFLVGDTPETQRKFSAHKFMLRVASPVFETMFYGALPEDEKNDIEITDIEAEAFNILLNFIYGIKFNLKSVAMAIKVCLAAEKYMMDHLKSICTEFLSSSIEVYDVSDIYLLASKIEDKELIKKCLAIFQNNTSEVLDPFNFDNLDIRVFSTILEQNELKFTSEHELFITLEKFAFYRARTNEKKLKSSESDTTNASIFNEFRELVKKIRFLCMEPEEFSSIALSSLLTYKESSLIMKCLVDGDKIFYYYPADFTKDDNLRCNMDEEVQA